VSRRATDRAVRRRHYRTTTDVKKGTMIEQTTPKLDMVDRTHDIDKHIRDAREQFRKENLGAAYGHLKMAKEKLDALCEAL